MNNKIIIKACNKQFELDLHTFDESTRQEIIKTFDQKELQIEQILRNYISKIQEVQQLHQNIQKILDKIN